MITIEDKHDCCGCTACETICRANAITMVPDTEGFLYPHIDTTLCSNCGLCEKICPVINRDKCTSTTLPLNTYALHNKDYDIWFKSSSGGVFNALGKYCIEHGGIVYGAEYNDNFIVVHKKECDSQGLLKFRGSKYVQSDIRGIYKDVKDELLSGRLVLFSGVPCQIEGLKNYLIKKYDNLITVDILCHGVPSPMIFAQYIDFIKKYSIFRLTDINMKDKTFGWGYQNLRLMYGSFFSEFNSQISNLWNKIYYDHIVTRPSCHKCRFKNLHRPGDLSIGDFWGIEKQHPDFYSHHGISLLLINSEYGHQIWDYIKNKFEYIESNTSKCLQPVLDHSIPEPDDRKDFWEQYHNCGFDRTIKNRYGISIISILKDKIKMLSSNINNLLTL